MNVLVTGGAGYVGAYVVRAIVARGHDVLVVDDLSNGHRDAVEPPMRVMDASRASAAGFDAIVHLAGRIEVGASARAHWTNNVGVTIALVNAALDAGVRKFVFASSAAVYGAPSVMPISEDYPCEPVNTYGLTKLTIEKMLASSGIEWTALRLFNVAGGVERHRDETHLIPLAMRGAITVHGSDLLVRDYVHVLDVAQAFALALEGPSGVYNVGSGVGATVRGVIEEVERVTRKRVDVTTGPPRRGDPSALVASIARARASLGWQPVCGLHEIVQSAHAASMYVRATSQ